MSKAEYEFLSKGDEHIQWKCPICVRGGGERIGRLEAMIQDLSKLVVKLTDKIDKMEEGQSLERKIEETVEKKLSEALDERVEREKRKQNIILVNVPESSKESPEDRKKEDVNAAKDLFKKVCPNTAAEIGVTEPVRIGKPEAGKRRLLRVKINSEEAKQEIVRQAYILNRDVKNPKDRIYINPDFTPTERKQQKELRDELRRRREEGERDIVIRNGKIVKKQNMDSALDTEEH